MPRSVPLAVLEPLQSVQDPIPFEMFTPVERILPHAFADIFVAEYAGELETARIPDENFIVAEQEHFDPGRAENGFLAGMLPAVWLSGISGLLVFKGFVYWRLLRNLRSAIPVMGHEFFEQNPRLRILLTSQIGPALAWLPGGQAILVPESLWDEADEEIRRGILRHELSHYRHRDGIKSLFAWLLATTQWFNPAAWFALKRFHDAAEWRCDAEAYGNREESLAEFAESMLVLHKTGDRYVGVLQTFRNRDLLERIQKLTEHQTLGKESTMKHLLLLSCVAVLLVAGATRIELVAKDIEPKTKEPTTSANEPETSANEPETSVSGLPREKGLLAVHPEADASGSLKKRRPDAEKRIFEKLEEPFLFDFKDATAYQEVLKAISRETGIDIFVDWGPLKKAGIDADNPVKLRLPTAMPLKDILHYLDKQVGTAWIVKNEMLNITTPDRAEGQYLIKSYYVGDLLRPSIPVYEIDDFFEPGKKIKTAHLQGHKLDVKDFRPLMDYITTMVAPESWSSEAEKKNAEIMEYYPNVSLVIRQTEDAHRQIIELLTHLRKYNDIQICFDIKRLPFEGGSAEAKSSRITIFSGQTGAVGPDSDGDYFVQLMPHSGKPVPPALMAKNEPFSFVVPKGTKWTVTGKAMKRDGNDTVTATVAVDGKKPETRSFYASPMPMEQEEVYLTGLRPQQQAWNTRNETVEQRVYDASDFVIDPVTNEYESGMKALVEMIRTVVCPDTWDEDDRVSMTAQGTKLVIKQVPSVHAEIEDIFIKLRELNDMQIQFEVSTLRMIPKTPGEDGKWNSSVKTVFNGQSQEIELDTDSAYVVRIRPAESTRLATDPVERKREILVSAPKGSKLVVRGFSTQDRQQIRLVVSVDGREIKTENFHARPISTR